MDDMLLKTENYWDDHLVELDHVLIRLAVTGMKVNPKKLCFGR